MTVHKSWYHCPARCIDYYSVLPDDFSRRIAHIGDQLAFYAYGMVMKKLACIDVKDTGVNNGKVCLVFARKDIDQGSSTVYFRIILAAIDYHFPGGGNVLPL